jgi:hypothetical protein
MKEIKEYQRKEVKICAKVLRFYDDINIRTTYRWQCLTDELERIWKEVAAV